MTRLNHPLRPYPAGRLATLVGLLLISAWSARGEALTLRANDALGQPGGVTALVVRTYAPRPVSLGQVCLRARPAQGGEAAGQPFAALEAVVVLSNLGDAQAQGMLDVQAGNQVVMAEFSSPSSGINRFDGPLAVFYLRLAADLIPGQDILVDVDLAATALFDEAGQPIPIDPRSGILTIRPLGAPAVLAADGDRVPAGTWADLGVTTYEPFPIASGHLALRYDPTMAAALPLVTMDTRRYPLSYTVDRHTPGLVEVDFQSLDGKLNTIPGPLVTVRLLTAWQQPPGVSQLSLDSQLTTLRDGQGNLLSLQLVTDTLELEPTTLLFAGGFDVGTTAGWSVGP